MSDTKMTRSKLICLVTSIQRSLLLWKELKKSGENYIRSVCDAILSRSYVSESNEALWGKLSPLGVRALTASKLEAKISMLLEKIKITVVKLESCVVAIEDSLTGFSTDNPSRASIFEDISTEAKILLVAMKNELHMRNLIVNDLLKCEDRDTLTVYTAAWVMEPYIEKNLWKDIEKMTEEANTELQNNKISIRDS